MTDPEPSARGRRGPAPRKPAELLWAAARLFGERGVAAVSTREIAAAAQTTERTLFKHYGSKDGLVRAVIGEAVVAHLAPVSLQALREAIEAQGDDLQAWHRALLHGRSQAMAKAPELSRLLVVELVRDDALRARFAEQWLQAAWVPLVTLLRRLQADGRVRADLTAESLARAFLSLNLGYLIGRHLLAPALPWDDAAEVAAIAALFGRGGAPAAKGA